MVALYNQRSRSPLSSLRRTYAWSARGHRSAPTQLFEAFALLNLIKQIFWLSWRPPLTLGLMGLNAAAFFAKGRVLPLLGPWTVSSCGFDGQRAYLLLRVLAVAARGGSRRLRWGGARGIGVAVLALRELVRRTLASQLLHVDTWHLYYNMTSLLWKGVELESQLGWLGLARLVVWSLLTAPFFALAASAAIAWAGWPRALRATTVGFSGVLFSLKVVANSNPLRHSVLPFVGIIVPSRLATWLELVIIQLLVPNTSFVGHLGGIFSGLAYLSLHRLVPVVGSISREQATWGPSRHRTRRANGAGAPVIANALQTFLRAIRQMQQQCQLLVRSLFRAVLPSRRQRPRFYGCGTTGARSVPVEVD